jgi:phosphoglycolate phosphatase
MGILSSNSSDNIQACLRANQADKIFAPVVGHRRLLGKGRALRRFLRSQCLPKGDVLYVGDEVRDIEAARQAGVDVAAVAWGANTRELLLNHRPDYLIESPGQLATMLE